MPKEVFEERELILEIFPGTSPRLLPLGEVLYYRDLEGRVHITEEPHHLVLEPLEAAPAYAPVICEACLRQLSRQEARFFRFEVGVGEGHYRYLSFCHDTRQCASLALPERLREILLRAIMP
ncbi:MAG: hypothetical protein M1369_00275 [Deinococcus sp.]|nr:hypothetical protein [Deinococcus sp.]MCL5964211.1 hypothetical protein [Deinococcus sp.]